MVEFTSILGILIILCLGFASYNKNHNIILYFIFLLVKLIPKSKWHWIRNYIKGKQKNIQADIQSMKFLYTALDTESYIYYKSNNKKYEKIKQEMFKINDFILQSSDLLKIIKVNTREKIKNNEYKSKIAAGLFKNEALFTAFFYFCVLFIASSCSKLKIESHIKITFLLMFYLAISIIVILTKIKCRKRYYLFSFTPFLLSLSFIFAINQLFLTYCYFSIILFLPLFILFIITPLLYLHLEYNKTNFHNKEILITYKGHIVALGELNKNMISDEKCLRDYLFEY